MNVAVVTAPAAARFGNLRHTALSAFWFGNFFMWQPLTTVVIQNQIDAVVPKANQGTAIGLAVSVGGLFAMTIPPIVGAISDRLSTPIGRRRPIMIGATLLTLPGLLVLATANNYPQIVIGYAIVQFFFNAAGAAFAGIIPDVVPAQDFGRASGFLATMVQLGSGAGLFANTLFTGAHQARWIYLAFAVVMVLTLVPTSLAAAGEGSKPPPPRQRLPLTAAVHEFFQPMLGGDFAWVIFTRFFVSAGITAVAYYLNNFFRDVVGATDPGTFTSEWFLVVLLVAIPFGLAGGYFSDRMHRRKIFVFASGGFQAFVALVFIVFFPTAAARLRAGRRLRHRLRPLLRGRLGPSLRHPAEYREQREGHGPVPHRAHAPAVRRAVHRGAGARPLQRRLTQPGLPGRVRERDRAAGHRHPFREPHQVRALTARA